MRDLSEDRFGLNHGWEHFWFTPNNLSIRECVKGPFPKPQLLFPIPYVTLSQRDGASLRVEEGVPDCWAEYLAHNSRFLRNYLGYYELMHKEDVEIVPQLRKNYRLYIGQGIPDPWTSYPFIDPDIAPRDSRDVQKFLNPSNRRKANCHCCEKKFLFECPDKSSVNDCPCKDCHGRSPPLHPDCGENCRCISVLRNWVLKNTELKRRRKPRRRRSVESDLSSSNDSKTEDEGPKGGSQALCECLRHCRPNSDAPTSDTAEESNDKPRNSRKGHSKSRSRTCCCPYVKNVYLPNHSSNERNFPECTKTISKEIQTESPPVKDSKTIQTDSSKPRSLPRCQCSSKCSRCGLHQCRPPWTKIVYPTMQSMANVCFTPNVLQNPAIICPYSFPNHVIIHKPSKGDEARKESKKLLKSRISEDDSNVGINRRQTKAGEESENKDLTEAKNDDLNNNKSVYHCQPLAKGFNHSKYLTNEKLRSYLQREARSPRHLASKFVNFCGCEPSVLTTKPETVPLDKLKAFSYYKPKPSDLFEESRAVYLGNGRRPVLGKQFQSSDQATMTVSEETDKPKKGPTRVKYLKEAVESSESRTFGLIRNSNDPYRSNRRRRRLLTNRKRRRKLADSGKSSILEYQALLEKLHKRPELANKQVQVEGTEQDFHLPKKVYFSQHNPSHSGVLNVFGDASSKFKGGSFNPVLAGTLRKIEQGMGKSFFGECSRSKYLGASLRQPVHQEMGIDKVLEKMSHPNRNNWTSSALKNIVNDLLTEKKSQEINVKV